MFNSLSTCILMLTLLGMVGDASCLVDTASILNSNEVGFYVGPLDWTNYRDTSVTFQSIITSVIANFFASQTPPSGLALTLIGLSIAASVTILLLVRTAIDLGVTPFNNRAIIFGPALAMHGIPITIDEESKDYEVWTTTREPVIDCEFVKAKPACFTSIEATTTSEDKTKPVTIPTKAHTSDATVLPQPPTPESDAPQNSQMESCSASGSRSPTSDNVVIPSVAGPQLDGCKQSSPSTPFKVSSTRICPKGAFELKDWNGRVHRPATGYYFSNTDVLPEKLLNELKPIPAHQASGPRSFSQNWYFIATMKPIVKNYIDFLRSCAKETKCIISHHRRIESVECQIRPMQRREASRTMIGVAAFCKQIEGDMIPQYEKLILDIEAVLSNDAQNYEIRAMHYPTLRPRLFDSVLNRIKLFLEVRGTAAVKLMCDFSQEEQKVRDLVYGIESEVIYIKMAKAQRQKKVRFVVV